MRKIMLGATMILGLQSPFSNAQDKPVLKSNKTADNKQKVVALLKAIETSETQPVSYINPNKYIQHNLSVENGVGGFEALLQIAKSASAKVNTARVFQDRDFVFTHTAYDFFGPKVGFDIFRFEDGKIVEHWDNLQERAKPNPSGHTMIDGEIDVKDLNKTEANKFIVKSFVDDILVNGKMEKLALYFNGDNYIQHNPFVADKLSGLEKALSAWAKEGITVKYEKVHKVLGEGNFVLVVSEGDFAGKHTSFYDLFRVENGKIAEHWDTIEVIPAKENWKNQNGKF